MGIPRWPWAIATLIFGAFSFGAVCPTAAAPVPFVASTADTNVVATIPPIEVSAVRPANDPALRLRPGFARAYDVSSSRGQMRMVSDILTSAVGVHVRQFGGVGSFSSVSIRGSSSGQVAVYLDGVPLNSAEYGVVNLADLPIAALNRIEVYRGSAPVAFKSAGGGVINLVSRTAAGTWARGSAGHGTFGTELADGAASWRRGRSNVFVAAQHLQSSGDFPYLDDNATPFNAADDSVRTRENNRLESIALTAKAGQRLGPIVLDLTHDHLGKLQGTPGKGANPAIKAHLRTQRDITNFRVRWANGGSSTAQIDPDAPSLRFYAVRQRDRFSDAAGELTGLRQDNDDRTRRLGAQLVGAVRLPLHQTLLLSGDGRDERYRPSINLSAPRSLPSSARRILALGAEDRWSLCGGHLAVVGAVHRDVTDDAFPGGPPYPGALPVPGVTRTVTQLSWNARARVDLTNALAFKASFARLARMPTLEELFGNRGGIYGNPRAMPELVETRDAGFVVSTILEPGRSLVRPSWIEGQLSGYRSDATDLLIFIQNSQRSSVAQNISAARLTGIELSCRAAWSTGLSADLSWTRQWTRDEGDVAYWRGRELPGRPRDESSLQLLLTQLHWRSSYEFHSISSNFLDRANLSPISSRTLHDVGFGLTPWHAGAEWFGEVRNVTDRRVEDFAGYPLPGRTLYVGLRLQHDRKEQPR